MTAQDGSAVEAGADPGVFRFARTGPTVAPLTIPFTLGGTATPDADYANTIGTQITIPLGQPFLDVQFTPTADGQVEGPETVIVTLLSGTYVIGSPNTATVTITDARREPDRALGRSATRDRPPATTTGRLQRLQRGAGRDGHVRHA